MKLSIKVLLVVMILLGVGAVSCNAQYLFFGNPLIGKEAPIFTLQSIDGKQVNIAELRGGKNAIYFFWATWCPHCRDAISEMNADIDTFKKMDIQVVLINVGENASVVKGFVDRYQIDLPILLDTTSKLADEYSLVGLPTFIYVKKDGTIRTVKHSLLENLEEVFNGKN